MVDRVVAPLLQRYQADIADAFRCVAMEHNVVSEFDVMVSVTSLTICMLGMPRLLVEAYPAASA